MVIISVVIIDFGKLSEKIIKSFKVWVSADTDTKYASKFEVDTGKKDNGPQKALGQMWLKS